MPAKLQAPGEYSGTRYTDSVQELSSSIPARDGRFVGVGLRKALLMALARCKGISRASRCTHLTAVKGNSDDSRAPELLDPLCDVLGGHITA